MSERRARATGSECTRVYLHLKTLFHPSGSRPARDRRPRKTGAAAGETPFGTGRDPKGLAETLGQLTAELGWESALASAELLSRWGDVVGDETAEHTEPVSVTRGVLTVRCTSTAWATQLRIMRVDLLARIENLFPDAGIEMIRFEGPDAPSWKRGLRAVPGRGPRDTYG